MYTLTRSFKNYSKVLIIFSNGFLRFYRGILAPLVGQLHNLYTNFWGAIADNGYYARSDDYLDIIDRMKTGVWNVPYITSVLVIAKEKVSFLLEITLHLSFYINIFLNSSFIFQYHHKFSHFQLMPLSEAFYYDQKLDPDMSFCLFARDHVSNHFLFIA